MENEFVFFDPSLENCTRSLMQKTKSILSGLSHCRPCRSDLMGKTWKKVIHVKSSLFITVGGTCGQPQQEAGMTYGPIQTQYDIGAEVIYTCRGDTSHGTVAGSRICGSDGLWTGSLDAAKCDGLNIFIQPNTIITETLFKIHSCAPESSVLQ